MIEFINHICYLYVFRTSPVHLQERFLQAVCADLVCGTTVLDVSSSTRINTYQSLRTQLVQNAPEDGPVGSETCRANICD